MKNEEILKRIISRVMKKEYPFIKDVNVTSERNMESYYVDKERNMTYNVWFVLGEYEPFDDWEKFEDSVISIRNAIGLRGGIRYYYLEADSDDNYE